MRYIGDVIEQIKKVAHENNENLWDTYLDKIIYDNSFKAPEIHYMDWGILHAYLHEKIGTKNLESWQKKIWSIFSTLPIEKIK